jgi:hypothetical protein
MVSHNIAASPQSLQAASRRQKIKGLKEGLREGLKGLREGLKGLREGLKGLREERN